MMLAPVRKFCFFLLFFFALFACNKPGALEGPADFSPEDSLPQSEDNQAAPPISLPAPTVVNMSLLTVSSPDLTGRVKIYGSSGAALADHAIEVYIDDLASRTFFPLLRASFALEGPFCNVQANEQGSFSCEIPADLGQSLCFKQVAPNGVASECAYKKVPEHVASLGVKHVIDVSVDPSLTRTFVLGTLEDTNEYQLDIYDNNKEFLLTSLDLSQAPGNFVKGFSSVSGRDGIVVLTDAKNGKLFTYDLNNQIWNIQDTLCPKPFFVRYSENQAFAGAAPNGPLVVCHPSNPQVAMNEQFLLDNNPGQGNVLPFSHVISVSSPAPDEYLVLVRALNGATGLIFVQRDFNGILTLNSKIYESHFVSWSSAKKFFAGQPSAPIFLALDQDTRKVHRLTEILPALEDILFDLPEDENAIDAVCESLESCDSLWTLNDQREIVRSILENGQVQVLEKIDLEAIDPGRLLIDRILQKKVILDPVGQIIEWK